MSWPGEKPAGWSLHAIVAAITDLLLPPADAMSNQQQQYLCGHVRYFGPLPAQPCLLADVILGPATATVKSGHVVALHSQMAVYFYAHSHAHQRSAREPGDQGRSSDMAFGQLLSNCAGGSVIISSTIW